MFFRLIEEHFIAGDYLAAGFFRYITKPIAIDELIEAVNSALQQAPEA